VNTLSAKVDAWQIGSTTPPSTCLSCGRPFTEKQRKRIGPINGPYRYVCAVCWGKPFLYFPGKVLASCRECWVKPGASCRGRHPRDPSRRKGSRVVFVGPKPLPPVIVRNSKIVKIDDPTFSGLQASE
jgi:hypothetical protein